MKKITTIALMTASIILTVPSHAEKHQHKLKSHNTIGCDSTKLEQRCAKTMSSTFDSNGRLWTAWTNGQRLYVNHSNDQGISFSAPILVNKIKENISARKEHRPKIKISNKGIVYLSWTTKLSKRFTGNIRFSKSTDNGLSFSTPITINDNLEIISHRFDSLAVTNSGHVYISWLDKRDQSLANKSGKKYNGAAAYYAVSTDSGNTFSKNKKLADNSCECCRMASTIDVNDLPVIAWRHIYDKNIRDHSIISFTDINTPSSQKRMSNDLWEINGCPHHGPSLSINKNNRYHSVWFNNAKKRHGIFYAYSDNKGDTFSKAINIGNYNKQASHADVKALGNEVYIAWKEFDTPYSKILAMASNDSGKSWGKEKVIGITTSNSDYPFLISLNKNIFISWHIPGQDYKLIQLKPNSFH